MPTHTNQSDQALTSGAEQVEQSEHLAASLESPADPSIDEVEEQNGPDGAPLKTALAELTLSMFKQGASTRVRVGNAHNSSELYEFAFASPDEANNAMLDAGILIPEQVPDTTALAGTSIPLHNITVEQLEAAGLKRHGSSTL